MYYCSNYDYHCWCICCITPSLLNKIDTRYEIHHNYYKARFKYQITKLPNYLNGFLESGQTRNSRTDTSNSWLLSLPFTSSDRHLSLIFTQLLTRNTERYVSDRCALKTPLTSLLNAYWDISEKIVWGKINSFPVRLMSTEHRKC